MSRAATDNSHIPYDNVKFFRSNVEGLAEATTVDIRRQSESEMKENVTECIVKWANYRPYTNSCQLQKGKPRK
ncbi:conserved hypothetical protein [Coccidioides posadasii str. Silveira]|uniref:Uncharacterized protein n=1 Tax=Coccidioides posadasii (strain RMSCC 757 / Silveira) TaxID=443226 RepID=E9D229_COCPS|nr:conserved hypothetical protein [Coccidioides posadasii str. Silveira]